MLLWALACADGPCATSVFFVDHDGDGFGGAETTEACAWEKGLAENDADCDDGDAAVFPEALERCNDLDDDCDGSVDEDASDQQFWYPDTDGDGHGTADAAEIACDAPPGFVADYADCDGEDPSVYPGADERRDEVDQDCDGEIDEDADDAPPWYADADLDGFGDPGDVVYACEAPADRIADGSDCADTRPDIHPAADELCNGRDEDCDGVVDEDAVDQVATFTDADGDGYGDPATEVLACSGGVGVEVGGDCDDADPALSPGADELCDGVDNNCDAELDEASAVDALGWYLDDDGDGYGAGSPLLWSCDAVYGHVSAGGDCDDDDAAYHPAATDVPGNRYDEDCDGFIDCYGDLDGDGFGGETPVTSADSDCRDVGEESTYADCDDTDIRVYTGAVETPYDGVDQDCDGSDLTDADGDGYDAALVGGDDCDDDDADVRPGAAEVCDGHDVDEDCDGLADDADPELSPRTYFADADGDGFGDPSVTVSAACGSEGYVPFDGDCDDADADVHPGADEACDATADQNCDGSFGETDGDGDGVIACADCNDADAASFPGAAEGINGVDDDCDTLIDEYVGDLTITSVTEATSFCATWQAVEGNLDLVGLTTLRDLGCLRAVRGYVRIGGVGTADLDGLGALTAVGGDLLIGGWLEDDWPLPVNGFTSLAGLDRLRTVGGHLRVCENEVPTLDGFPRLEVVGGSFVLLDMPIADVEILFPTLGGDVWLEELPNLRSVHHGAIEALPGSLWIENNATDSGAFTLDWGIPIGGSLALVDLPAGADAGWTLPDQLSGLYIEENAFADLAALAPLRVVTGDVVLSGNTALADLSGLDGLATVDGDLTLSENAGLADAGGFAGLTQIGGWLRVESSTAITVHGFGALTHLGSGLNLAGAGVTDLGGFGALTETPDLWLDATNALADTSALARIRYTDDVTLSSANTLTDLSVLAATGPLAGNLAIDNCSGLTSLNGAEGIPSVGAAVTIEDNRALVTLDGLDNLATIGGALTLSDLGALTDVSLPALTTVGGDVALDDLTDLETLDGLASLVAAGGLWVNSNDLLRNLDGLVGITTIDGSIIIDSNPALVSLGGLQNLTSVGGNLDIQGNSVLLDLVGLDALTSVGGTLSLKRNAAFQRPDSLAELRSVGGDLWVEGNRALEDMGGLGPLTVGGAVYFYDNDALRTLYGLDGLTEVGGNLLIADADALESLAYLSALSHVGGDLRIAFNALLPDLHGLDALVSVDGDVEIGGIEGWSNAFGWNAALLSLDGLDSLSTIGGDLRITNNPVLFDIEGIGQVVLIGEDLVVTDNTALPTVLVDGFRYGGVTIGGEVSVYGNL